MSKAVPIVYGGKTFLIETDDTVQLPASMAISVTDSARGFPEGLQPVVNLDRIEREFGEVTELIVYCCNGLLEGIERLPRLEKVAVEFGIKLAGEAGFPMLTKASGEANFKISVEWKKSTSAPAQP